MADARSGRRNPFKPTAGMRPPELIGDELGLGGR